MVGSKQNWIRGLERQEWIHNKRLIQTLFLWPFFFIYYIRIFKNIIFFYFLSLCTQWNKFLIYFLSYQTIHIIILSPSLSFIFLLLFSRSLSFSFLLLSFCPSIRITYSGIESITWFFIDYFYFIFFQIFYNLMKKIGGDFI